MPATFQPGPRDTASGARRGALLTSRGRVETPAFMPVGTRATVTGLTPADLRAVGARIILGNTYHLLLRPGPEAMRPLRRPPPLHGLGPAHPHRLGRLPDLLALPADRIVTEEGARFKSYIDGR